MDKFNIFVEEKKRNQNSGAEKNRALTTQGEMGQKNKGRGWSPLESLDHGLASLHIGTDKQMYALPQIGENDTKYHDITTVKK